MERLARLHGLLDEIHAETMLFTTVEDAARYAGLVEQAARKIDALAVGVLDSVDRSGLHKDDGFSKVQSWNGFVCRTTRGETARRAGLATPTANGTSNAPTAPTSNPPPDDEGRSGAPGLTLGDKDCCDD
jgi:hypothetical protein